jgi:hypothetical protein
MASGGQVRVDGNLKIDGELRLTAQQASVTTALNQSWFDTHGMQQLCELNAMERGQDFTTWSTNAIYSATNGVLIVAAVTAFAYDVRWLIISLLGILGSFLSIIWFQIVLRAHQYEITYLYRARWLQKKCTGLPPECAVWQEPDGTPKKWGGKPPGTPSWRALCVLVAGFFLLWAALVFLAIILGIRDIQTGISDDWKSMIMIVGTSATIAVTAIILYGFFIRPVRETNDYFGDLRKDLELS